MKKAEEERKKAESQKAMVTTKDDEIKQKAIDQKNEDDLKDLEGEELIKAYEK